MIRTALCLPAPDIEALIQGRTIAAMPRRSIIPGQQFALYPCDTSINSLPDERYYHSNFLPIAQTTLANLGSETVFIKAWARYEHKEYLDNTGSFNDLSQLTVWTPDALHKTLLQRQQIFLTYLRVYLLPQQIKMPVHPHRQFVPLSHSLNVAEALPVLSDRTFAQRKHQLEKREPPLHPELEELQSATATLAHFNTAAEELDQDIKVFLGWGSDYSVKRLDSDLIWIQTIAEIGNSSDGQTFEKLVRKSLIKLGFSNSNHNSKASLDPEGTGGSGGIDFYCEKPYPVVGECKASKNESVPNKVSAQLIHLGLTHLGQAQYERSIKLIVAAGSLTEPARKAAIENKMNVIRPETIQKLVEMQAQHKGSINLLELKQCLQQTPFGLADDKVNSYIEKISQNIKLRSHLVQLVKKHLENTGDESVGVDALHGAYVHSNPPQPLRCEEMHDILLELSSPLTGYLGRIRGSDWTSDRFYFLRDLPID